MMSAKYIFWIMMLGLFSCSDSPSTPATENIETNEIKVDEEPSKAQDVLDVSAISWEDLNYDLTDVAGKKLEREGILFSVDPAEPHFPGIFSLITDPAKLSAISVYYEGAGVDGIVDSKYSEMIGEKVKITYSSELEEVVDSYELFTDETVTQKEGLKPYIGLFDCDEPAEFGEEETFIYLNTDAGKETFLQKNLTEKEVGLRGKKVIVYTKQVADRWLLDIQTL